MNPFNSFHGGGLTSVGKPKARKTSVSGSRKKEINAIFLQFQETDKRVRVKKERMRCNFFFEVPRERDNRVKVKTDSLNHLLSRIYFKNYCYRRKLKCNLFKELVQSKEKKKRIKKVNSRSYPSQLKQDFDDNADDCDCYQTKECYNFVI